MLFKETAGAPVQVFKKTLKVINTVKKKKYMRVESTIKIIFNLKYIYFYRKIGLTSSYI